MRKETTTRMLYFYDELTDKGKENAVDNLRDINFDYDWWIYIYEDAARIGLKLEYFDLDRNRHASGKLTENVQDVINKIMAEHGESCDTFKLADSYKGDVNSLCNVINLSDNDDDIYDAETALEDIETEFEKALLEEYSVILQKEYEYLIGDESIIETIRSNEYEFTEDGKLA